MPYADVTNPVKIVLSKDLAAKVDNFLRRMCIVSTGDTNLTLNTFKEVTSSNYTTILKTPETDTETSKKLKGFFAFATNKSVIVLEVGVFNATSNTIATQVASLKNFILGGLSKCYMFLVPDGWYYPALQGDARDLAFSSLAQEFNGFNANTYFIVRSDNQDPSTSESFKTYKGSKSVFVVFDNALPNYFPLASIFLGVMASSKFDISDTQRGTPLNNKAIEGAQINEISSVLAQNLTQAPVNFAGDFVGNKVLYNGRYADGSAWEYYYQADLMIFRISEALQGLLLNSANNSNYVLQYNQDGIDVISATISSVLDRMKSQGVITEYAKSKNVITNQLEDIGSINAIDFWTYKNNNPEDYTNEIYGGVSFYALIGRYIKQVNLAITIG